MDLLTRNDVVTLMNERQGNQVSIYMPAHRSWKADQQDPIRFKNLLKEARELLSARGMPREEIERLAEPADKVVHDTAFWQYQNNGLAVFISPGRFMYYRLPLNFPEMVVVSDRFQAKPLLELFMADRKFYLLCLSKNEVRFFQGTHYTLSRIDLKNIPARLSDTLQNEVYDHYTDSHLKTNPRAAKGYASFHGQGVGVDDAKDELFRYFRQIDKGLHEILRDEKSPLVLAAVEYLVPIYRDANTYQFLAEKFINGNPERLGADELHSRAWEILEPDLRRVKIGALDRYMQTKRILPRLVTNDPAEIVKSAVRGRVDTLFVVPGVKKWGSFDPGTNNVVLHDTEEAGDEDLFDLAAMHTFLHEGEVYMPETDVLPDESKAAAVLRY